MVIVSYNSTGWLPQCLSSILKDGSPGFSVHVIDNASSDGSADLVEKQFPGVMVTRSKVNLGFAGGVNLGIRSSDTDVTIALNPDVIIDGHSLSRIAEYLMINKEVAIAGCKLLFPDGKTIQHAGGRIDYPSTFAQHYGYGEEDTGQWDNNSEVDYVTGAVFAVKKSIIEKIGYLDEGFYPAYFEEADICFRARKAGYKVVYLPHIKAIHHESVTTGKETPFYLQMFHRNRLRFALKHYSTEQLRDDFLPAEIEVLLKTGSLIELKPIGKAYDDNLAAMNGCLDFFANPTAVAELSKEEIRKRLIEVLQQLFSLRLSLIDERDWLVEKNQGLVTERDWLVEKNQGLVTERDWLVEKNQGLVTERDWLVEKNQGFVAEKDWLWSINKSLTEERDWLAYSRQDIVIQRDHLLAELYKMISEKDRLFQALQLKEAHLQRIFNSLPYRVWCQTRRWMPSQIRRRLGSPD